MQQARARHHPPRTLAVPSPYPRSTLALPSPYAHLRSSPSPRAHAGRVHRKVASCKSSSLQLASVPWRLDASRSMHGRECRRSEQGVHFKNSASLVSSAARTSSLILTGVFSSSSVCNSIGWPKVPPPTWRPHPTTCGRRESPHATSPSGRIPTAAVPALPRLGRAGSFYVPEYNRPELRKSATWRHDRDPRPHVAPRPPRPLPPPPSFPRWRRCGARPPSYRNYVPRKRRQERGKPTSLAQDEPSVGRRVMLQPQQVERLLLQPGPPHPHLLPSLSQQHVRRLAALPG